MNQSDYTPLYHILYSIGVTQRDLGRYLDISSSAVSALALYNKWPKKTKRADLQEKIFTFLREKKASPDDIATVKKFWLSFTNLLPDTLTLQPEEITMLLRKNSITAPAKQHFKLFRDPFTDEMTSTEDVFLSDDLRYARAKMRSTAKNGGILAIIGESGAGKSTLRHDLIDWLITSEEPVTIIEPYVLGMESTDKIGRTLRASEIAAAVIRTISPGARLRHTQQDRSQQMHDVLKASARMGRRHLLIIEEAHSLAIPTLKHLKRFYEIQDGFKKLLSIILIGQTELEHKLSEYNPEVREVVQRCEVATIQALGADLKPYLEHKFKRAGVDLEKIFDDDAINKISEVLHATVNRRVFGKRENETISLCYPLAVNNLVSGALNAAAHIGASQITADIIMATVRRN